MNTTKISIALLLLIVAFPIGVFFSFSYSHEPHASTDIYDRYDSLMQAYSKLALADRKIDSQDQAFDELGIHPIFRNEYRWTKEGGLQHIKLYDPAKPWPKIKFFLRRAISFIGVSMFYGFTVYYAKPLFYRLSPYDRGKIELPTLKPAQAVVAAIGFCYILASFYFLATL